MLALPGVDHYFSAWYAPREGEEARRALREALAHHHILDDAVREVLRRLPEGTLEQQFGVVCRLLQLERLAENPLFRRSVYAHLREEAEKD